MKKRGQAGEVIKYALIALVAIAIMIFGYKSFLMVRERMCQAEITKFKIELSNLDKEVKFGSVEQKTFSAPCNADEIFFLDLEKEIPLNVFSRLPVIKDSVKDKAQKNVFVAKGNKVLDSFYAGNLEFSYPYHACLRPGADRINFFIEGAGNKVKLIPGCMQLECTDIPINVSEEDARKVLAEFTSLPNCENCPSDVQQEIEDFRDTIKKVNLFRRYSYCADTGITNVEIIIKPKEGTELKNFRFFEFIPKECVEDLNAYLAETIEGDVVIKADPLIMWQFDAVADETVIGYKLKKQLSEECKQAIEGLGIAELALSGETEAGPPVISNLPDVEFDEDDNYRAFDLDSYVKDPNNADKELVWSYSGNNKVNVDIGRNKRVRLGAAANWNGNEQVTFTVADPDGNSDSDSMSVTVKPVNDPPDANLPEIIFDEDTVFTLDLSQFIDIDGTALSFQVQGSANINAQINGNILALTPNPNFSGEETIRFVLSDGVESVNKNVKATVRNINDAPSFSPIPDKILQASQLNYNNLLDLRDYANDFDTSNLAFSIVSQSNPDLVSCLVSGNKVDCEVKKNENGVSEVVVQASDGTLTAAGRFNAVLQAVYEPGIAEGYACGDFNGQASCLDLPAEERWVEVPVNKYVNKIEVEWCCRRNGGGDKCVLKAGSQKKERDVQEYWWCGIPYPKYKDTLTFNNEFVDKVKITGNDGRRAVFVKIYDVDIEEVGCAGTDASCGFYPNCANCNSQDGFSSANYCSGNNVVRDYRDGYCAANVCVSSATQPVQQQCNNANQACENGNCNTIVCSDGTLRNQCSSTRPLFCDNNLNLANNCNACGCPSGQNCQSNGQCVAVCQDTSWSPDTSTVCSGQSFTQTSNCGNTRAATGTKSCQASLSASLVVTSTEDLGGSDVKYNFDMTISESNGVTATIQPTYQRCFQSEGCQTGTTAFGTISANGQKTRSGWFNTPYHPNKVEYIFSWTDANGNSGTVTASYNIP